ncbi:nucleosome assembly protein-domain-containing protein [Phycomyces blakesleeanus]|uniref:Nucleosome assembly protein n=2 Tax=Phycomyces blakesleeanus TaxID=4837 RepID=A0A167JLV2_PHYB8|nr:hypothetical protein PHYBLDRAFT_152601 [Phycomyces blakesleeanus NRRL 1555(-)]OAD66276.1 hypothetical protein PHYBLDRAFT_152601 [Phycomyces blakesleeanus NRRL 1555(-)]|eukprot:XP_018284316.1 hypothetical protein PHYBLDRAFT_152601 [Phycomyces blakesleeanus NRRL 1555(-)]
MDKKAASNVDIKNKKLGKFTAPTPQNTPINPAPMTSTFRPTVTTISENETINTASASTRFAGLTGRTTVQIESLPSSVRRRVNGLKYFQSKHTELEEKFQEEVLALEKKYLELYRPLYNQRAKVVSGQYEPTEEEVALGEKIDEEESVSGAAATNANTKSNTTSTNNNNSAAAAAAKQKKKDDDEDDNEILKGIPEFWLTTLKNHPQTGETIAEADEKALKHLVDVRMSYMDKPGFQLEFEFTPNEFFSNKSLTKTYFYQDHAYGGDFVYDHADGCDIQWKEGKDLTVTVETKKQRHKGTNKTRVVKRTVPADSFFTFFNPPAFPEDAEELDEEEAEGLDAKLEADYELGEEFKDKIIPHAVDYFTGKALEYEEFEGDDDFEDDFYDEDEEEEEEDDDDEYDDEHPQPAKGDNTPECKQS